jgi:uncharacterized membrane protein YjfL (UPF0719 family)
MAYCLMVDCVTSIPFVEGSSKLVLASDASPSDELKVVSGTTSLLLQAAKGNVAAGFAVGGDMVSMSIIIASPIIVGYSIVAWIIYVTVCLMIIMPLLFLYIEHVVLRSSIMTSILKYNSIGAATLLGSLKFVTALLLQSLYRANCDLEAGHEYSACIDPGDKGTIGQKLGRIAAPQVFNVQSLIDLVLLFIVIIVAKGVYYLRFRLRKDGANFSLDATLVDPKNDAVAVSLAAYAFAQGLCVVGAAYCPNPDLPFHFANIVAWTAFGCLLVYLASLVNDWILMHGVSNTAKLLENNVAIAVFEGGSFIACGLILRANLLGSGNDTTQADYGRGLGVISVFWLVCQGILLAFAYTYRLITSFDDHAELAEGNMAAGFSGGTTLIALALVMSYPLSYYISLIIFLPISIVGALALMVSRVVVDRLLLPGDSLDHEIKVDKNWGAALIEGMVALGVAWICNMFVPTPGNPMTDDLICPAYDS